VTRLVLLGLPGSGASGVGRLLAERWRVPLHDSDRELERRFGMSIGQIIVDAGERAFRDAERQVVLAALAGPADGVDPTDAPDAGAGVVVVGGGAAADPDVARAVSGAGAPVAFLDVSLASAVRRLGLQGGAVGGLGSPRAIWQRLAGERRRSCSALATIVLPTDEVTVEQVADELAGRLGRDRG
jgi:shikimate kinase